MKKIKCTRCGKELKGEDPVILELSNTDGHYYQEIPKEHVSQGGFPFGLKCATLECCDTVLYLSKELDRLYQERWNPEKNHQKSLVNPN